MNIVLELSSLGKAFISTSIILLALSLIFANDVGTSSSLGDLAYLCLFIGVAVLAVSNRIAEKSVK